MDVIDINKARKLLANNITYFRFENDWTQEELAEKVDVSPNYVSDIENGKRNITIDIINRIAKVFGIEVIDLFVQRPIINNKRNDLRKK